MTLRVSKVKLLNASVTSGSQAPNTEQIKDWFKTAFGKAFNSRLSSQNISLQSSTKAMV